MALAISPTSNSVSLRFDASIAAFGQSFAASRMRNPARCASRASAKRPWDRRPDAAKPSNQPWSGFDRVALGVSYGLSKNQADGSEAGPNSTEHLERIELSLAIGTPAADAVSVDVVKRLLVPSGAAAMSDRLIERPQLFQIRLGSFLGIVPQMLIETAMGPRTRPPVFQRAAARRTNRGPAGGRRSYSARPGSSAPTAVHHVGG